MQESLSVLLQVQELDIKMIRLMRVKNARNAELKQVCDLQQELEEQMEKKHQEILDLKTQVRLGETNIKVLQEKVIKLEDQQASVKKMDEFNALTQEITRAGKERATIEHHLSDLMDKIATEEDLFATLQKNLELTKANGAIFEQEVRESVIKINEEGQALLHQREALVSKVPGDLFKIYERLLKNKRDRVVVPIEHRVCSGCHIVLTAQHENLIRRKEKIVFCEHCSRILYWEQAPEEEEAPRKRRRRSIATTTA